ncbi:hypothetical protein [Photobacterium carnosum]|uniref:hypothetical protein n=1 Tax=Photobacterium carnosum TaxID=2023717 RepID=UPI00128C8F10|nr:hypothetical protein [Photobacterium carnosum]KAE8176525.1 hypothetical protein CIT27_12000 [Photobacterium carnosum]MCD9527021.1 hypothetical protein [Photobacterium carnosum]
MPALSIDDLILSLKDLKIEQKDFLNKFYNDIVFNYVNNKLSLLSKINDQFNEDKDIKDKFIERSRLDKKLEQRDKIERNPELLAMLLYYFNNNYREDDIYTISDREAAWEMYVEIDTRIITQPLSDGIDLDALKSFHSIFDLHRNISRKHGLRCKRYYELITSILNNDIRPFTSKWHTQLTIEKKTNQENILFREELKLIQEKMTTLKSKLKHIIEN